MNTTTPPLICEQQPVSKVIWLHRSTLSANDYNPNKVAPPEMELLRTSILSSGWTQPIVINPDKTIVDGFHRFTNSGHKDLAKFEGFVPVVITAPADRNEQMMATIRHNRARGTHWVLEMANILKEMVKTMPVDQIMQDLGMEKDEVIRLCLRVGIPQTDLIMNQDYSKSWKPGARNA